MIKRSVDGILKASRVVLATFLIVIPIVVAVIYTYLISVDVPYFDEWILIPLIEKWHEGNGSWSDIFQPYLVPPGSYVVPLAKGTALLSAYLFHWDIRFEIAIGIALLIATALVFALYARRIGGLSSQFSSVMFLLPTMLLLFSLRQFENFIGPWGIGPFGVICFVMGAAYLISQFNSVASLIGAMVCGIMASLFFTNGLLVWGVGLAALIVQRRWRDMVYWLFVATIFLVMYFGFMYVFVPIERPATASVVLLRFFGVLGGALAMDKSIVSAGASGAIGKADVSMAVIIGLCIFSLTCFLLWQLRSNIRHFIVPVTGIFLSILSCLMFAYGRAEFGLEQVFASRYSTYPLLLLASLLTIIVQLRLRGTHLKFLESAILIAVFSSTLYSTLTETMMLPHRHAYLQSWADNVRNYASGADLTNPHFSKETMYEYAASLDRMKMSVFRE